MKIKDVAIKDINIENNPRQNIDKNELTELAESINSRGLLQPIGLKELKMGKYELIFGFRRLEAFKQLGLQEIPALINNSEDTYSLKIIENLQRKDIPILELAKAIKKYQKDSGLTLTEIASTLGKTLRQVSQINKLNDLIKPLQIILSKGKIELDAAYFISRYPGSEQIDFIDKYGHYSFIEIEEATNFFKDRNLKLKNFQWLPDKKFKDLPKCTECNDRSSLQSVLFPENETKDDKCLNRNCMETKVKIHLNDVIAETQTKGEIILIESSWYPRYNYAHEDQKVFKKDSLQSANNKKNNFIYGITIASDSITDIGQVHKYVKPTNSKNKNISSTKTKIDDLNPAQQKARRIEQYKRKKELILFPMAIEIGKQITDTINKVDFKKYKTIPVEALSIIADYVLERAGWEFTKELQKIWTNKTGNDLANIYLMLIKAATYESFINVNDEYYATSSRYKRLKAIAPVLGIDLDEIEKNIKPKFDEKVASLKEKFYARNKFDPEKIAIKKTR